MTWNYEKYTMLERAEMEQEFRRLISIIPVFRQRELFEMEKHEAEIALLITKTDFDQHWAETSFPIPTPKKEENNA